MSVTTKYSEEELVVLLKQRLQSAFNYLYDNYSATLYGVIRRTVQDEQIAQDVLQEVFVKIWNSIESYDPEKARIYTWMINIARNASIDKLRSKGEKMQSKIQNDDSVVYDKEADGNIDIQTDAIGLWKAVEGLKPEYATLINLAYHKGFTQNEISEKLAIPLGTVKTRMRQAMKLLKEHFST
ncbi:MAG: RNA polymerase sigma factor [Flavipsychrobacter sp.]